MKKCFKCGDTKRIEDFYKHPRMRDGHLGKCKQCTKKDARKRTVRASCGVCKKEFMTWPHEIKRGGGKTCSRACYYVRVRRILETKFSVKDTYSTIHKWVYKNGGKASVCENCYTESSKAYHWSNISGAYRQDMSDWWQLCVKCHSRYDNIPQKAWETRRRLYGRSGCKKFLTIEMSLGESG